MTNRLAREQSLYLRQHSENPVDWYPWGPEALARARAEARPILLSIGYSACHWCHVMERESFENPEVARVMNEGFVCVKVDREERPDVDGIYMRAVQALTGHGGWPLTVFLTPDGHPFYGGTYFPPVPRHGIPSFPQLLSAIGTAWTERREQISATAERIGQLLRESTLGYEGSATREGPVTREGTSVAARRLLGRYDPTWGGFGSAPKFPQPVVLEFLLEHHVFTGDAYSLEAVLHTLRCMAGGGMRDQLGGGFHRYSVDHRWLVPHFEKMLYDNALLASLYLRAFQASGEQALLRVCRGILDDMLSDFRSPEGGFYAARDADSEGEEGLFYLWSREEVDQLLGEDGAPLFARVYDITPSGNFEGRNILHLPHDPAAVARDEGIPPEEMEERLAKSRRLLLEARSHRPPPARDEKVLAGWNALMIRALAEAGAVLGDERYLGAASTGARWLMDALQRDGRLLHQVPARRGTGEGAQAISAFLDDVAGMGNALLTLHESTLETVWLEGAIRLGEEVEERFRDPTTGLLHDTPHDAEGLVVRPRETMDNPIPSGTSLAAELHLRLGRLLGDEERVELARAIVAREAGAFDRVPSGFGRLLTVANRLVHDPVEVAILGRRDQDTRDLLAAVNVGLHPGMVVTGRLEGDRSLGAANPLLEGREMVQGRPTAFVCSRFACRLPSSTPEALLAELSALEGGRRA